MTEGGSSLNEVVRALATAGILWRIDGQARTRSETSEMVRGPWIGSLVDLSHGSHNLDPDLGLFGDLVPETDALQILRKSYWSIATEESGKDLTDSLRDIHGVHPNVVSSWARSQVTERIDNE